MGSGSIAAMSMLETGYRDGMNAEEAKKLVHAAISAGIFNDPFSGTNVDLCVITPKSTELLTGYDQPNERKHPKENIKFAPGTAPVLKEEIRSLVTIEEVAADVEA